MWASTGRSGYGDSTIGGDYDSWDGVSPNGRQYKNEATMETRDLSGADYWHLRKQNRPVEEIPADLHMLKNGKANINAYADKEPAKKASKVSIQDRILPQQRRVTTLTNQMVELVAAYKAGQMDIEEYSTLMDVLVVKKARAEFLLNKALSTKPLRINEEDDLFEEYDTQNDDSCEDDVAYSLDNNTSKLARMPNELAGFIVMSMVGFMGLLWLFN